MAKLILMRHGESEWNKTGLFTGWVDIPLSMKGIDEAIEAGKAIADIPIDFIFVSSLMRAQMTAMIVMSEHKGGRIPVITHPENEKIANWEKIYSEETKKETIPVISAWELNERMYGELQGKNKQKTREQYGDEQVKIWRRSFRTEPPSGESLAMTANRSIPYFKKNVIPLLSQGKNVYISAHGNSLRSIVMFLDNLSEDEVLQLEIATGAPILYDYDNGVWKKNG